MRGCGEERSGGFDNDSLLSTEQETTVSVAVTVCVNTASEDMAVVVSGGAERARNLDFPFRPLVPLCTAEEGEASTHSSLCCTLHILQTDDCVLLDWNNV